MAWCSRRATYAQGCEAQLKLGLYRPLDRLRGHRVVAVDEERGLVVTASIADFSMAQRQYTLTDGRKVEAQAVHACARAVRGLQDHRRSHPEHRRGFGGPALRHAFELEQVVGAQIEAEAEAHGRARTWTAASYWAASPPPPVPPD